MGLGASGSEVNDSIINVSAKKRSCSKKITREKGEETAQFEGFVKYIETSALFGEGVKNVFDETIHAMIKDQAKY
jgi:hypothetical protein